MVRLETVLDSWRTVRADTAQAVEEFPASELDFRPVPDVMSFRDIAVHILQAGHGLTGLLLDGVENLATPDFRERVKERGAVAMADGSPRALAAALRESVQTRCRELAEQPPEFFSGLITRMDGQRVTRLEMLQFVKEHELSHRAQLFLYLRLKGLVPPTTRRRMAQK
ncbi:MAG TPA: DinB family protein [Bryobacteraceae bacterium]|nr:DinB family protein [Bryobacteraceae bacterium]